MQKTFTLLITLPLFLLSSCIFFQNINQPAKSLPKDIVTVSIHTTTEGTGPIHSPYFGIYLPVGWTIPGDSIECKGVYNKVIYYNDSLSFALNAASPASLGYYWWVGKGEAVSTINGNVYAVVSIQTDKQIGLFSIDYMLGDSFNGVNQQRSDDHQIEIVEDENSPRRLRASVEGSSVLMNWNQPLNTSGLIGYNIYRDEEKINSEIVTNTNFYDTNPVEGIHYYTIASYYNIGEEYMMPYDRSVVYQSIYVSPNGSNANKGSSFNDALQTISYAMSVIKVDSLNPITIFLAPGIYSPYTNEEQYPITGLNYVSIKGSEGNITYLRADGQNSALQFVETQGTNIHSLNISNGSSGVYCYSSSVNFFNVNISENTRYGIQCINSNTILMNAEISNDGSYGMYCDNSNTNLINVTLSYNGYGIKCQNNSTLTLENIIIKNNNGFGIKCKNNSALSLENSIIKNNNGVGIDCENSNPFLENVTITNNNGGGINCNNSALELIDVKVTNNISANGAGINSDNSAIDLADVIIANNIATDVGGGIYCKNNSILNFDSTNRSSIYFNQALWGSDIYSDTLQNVIVDTFSVFNPTSYYTYPVENFTFDILHGLIGQVEADLFVSPEGDDTNSGLTENDPLKTIHCAFGKILVDSLHPHTINLLEGTYSQSSNGEFFPINVPDFVSLSGESDSSVIIDAEGISGVIRIYCNSESLISDLTIKGGNGDGISVENSTTTRFENLIVTDNSTGISCDNSNPNLENIIIETNDGAGIRCSNSSPILDIVTISGNNGNGIHCENNSNPEMINVTIIDNEGRGISCWNSSSPTLENVIINNNNDGGIYCENNSNITLENGSIENNSAMSGGGIYCKDSNPIFENVEVSYNGANRGGGIYCRNSNPIFENVTISNNIAAEEGGGVRCLSSNPIFENVEVSHNSARSGGGLYCTSSDPVIKNVIISNNISSSLGGGLYCVSSDPIFENVTISNNSAVYGGGIFCSNNSDLLLRNCILWNDSPEEIYNITGATVTILYTDIQGGQNGINGNGTIHWLEGNMDEDPLFGGIYLYMPFTLSSFSPCIDVGDPDTVYNDPEDPNNLGFALWPAMGTVRNDMGAYGGPNAAPWKIIVKTIEDEDTEEIQNPTEFELAQNYPNPFNPSTTIRYSIKERSNVELILYDILGCQVKVLVNEEQDTGHYRINFNAGKLASGIYFYRIQAVPIGRQAGSFIETKKMILLK